MSSDREDVEASDCSPDAVWHFLFDLIWFSFFAAGIPYAAGEGGLE